MRSHAWDSVFVRASRAQAHPLVRDPAAHGRWWPRLTVADDGDGWTRQAHGRDRLGERVRLAVRVTSERRPDKGIHLDVRGDLAGRAEWYYLDEIDGIVVHHLFDAESGGRLSARRLAAYRASVRAGLNALKDLLEGGRPPGEEPDPALVAHQSAVAAELRPQRGRGGRP